MVEIDLNKLDMKQLKTVVEIMEQQKQPSKKKKVVKKESLKKHKKAIERKKFKPWTKKEEQTVIDLYRNNDKVSEEMLLKLSREINRTLAAVKNKIHRMKVKDRIKRSNSYKRWTKKEDNIIKEKYGKEDTNDIADELRRTPVAIRTRASELEVTKGRNKNSEILEDIDNYDEW